MMRRSVAPLVAVLSALGVMAAGSLAQVASGSIASELLVLPPQGKHLAVYEQVVLAHPGATTTLGVLAGHGAVKGANVQRGPTGPHHGVLEGAMGTVWRWRTTCRGTGRRSTWRCASICRSRRSW